MSKIDTLRPDSRPSLLVRWKHFWMRTAGDIGILGFGLRWGVLLLFAAYFFIPILWLVLATSKSAPQLLELKPLAFGSFQRIQAAWQRIIEYQDGEVLLWAFNSIRYAAWALALSLVISSPAGYILAVARFPGRRLLLWLTLITMLLPPSAQANTIRHRNAKTCAEEGRAAHRWSVPRSSSVSTTTGAIGPGIASPIVADTTTQRETHNQNSQTGQEPPTQDTRPQSPQAVT